MALKRWDGLMHFLFTVFIFVLQEANAAQVASFYPTGSVKNVQQVTVRFSTDMVAIGDPRSKSDPFIIECNVRNKKTRTAADRLPEYATRWADSKHWILDFEKPLQSGVRCSFKLKSNTKDLLGEKIEALNEYSLSTAGPALLGVVPVYGEIEPDQYFVALADGTMDLESVKSRAYFEVEGMPDKVPVKIIAGKPREAVLKAAIKSHWEWNAYRKIQELKPLKPFSQIKEMENFIALSASRRFPEKAKVVLHWPKGIRSKTGLYVEEAQHFEFNVIDPFQAKFYCERSAPERPCNPALDMRVNFSKNVPLTSLQGTELVAANGQIWIPLELKVVRESQTNSTQQLTFKGPFPETTQFKLILPRKLKDELGRSLSNQGKYPLQVATDEYSPLIKFPASFGILEREADPALPVSARNIEQFVTGKILNFPHDAKITEIVSWYRKVLQKDDDYEKRNESLLKSELGLPFQLPKLQGARAAELIGIPLKKPGFYVVEMASPRLGQALTGKSPMYVATSALVTDMAVHFKKGRESTLVWVTQLSSAKPVSEAKVSIVDASGKEIAEGSTSSDGTVRFGKLPYPCSLSGDEGYIEVNDTCEVFAFAKKGDDLSFASSNWSKGIELYRFNVPTEYISREWGPVVLHTVLDRMTAQPGEAVQMKHVLREHRESGFAMINEKNLPKQVFIVHQGSKKKYTLPFEFNNATGTALNEFIIPKEAPLGRYSIYLSHKNRQLKNENEGNNDSWDWTAQETGYFLVSAYRLPLMKADIQIHGAPLIRPSLISADLAASYLSGGPAKGLKVKLRASLRPGFFSPDVPGAPEYNFFSTPVKTGVIASEERQVPEDSFLNVQELTLDENGGLLAQVPSLPKITKIQQLVLEMDYTDPNGEIKTTTSQMNLFPADSVIGLRSDGWYAEPGKTKVMGVITDIAGRPQANRNYTIEAFRTNYITHRKRLVGGFYSYDSKSEVMALGKVCEGQSDELGRFLCEPKNLPAGSITLQAKTEDSQGHPTYASVHVSVHEAGTDQWWVPSDSDRIDLLPERDRYEPHEKAKLVVRSPYAVSTVLVTVEREGVLDAFVSEVHRDNPIIEVPLKGNYAPNVFVSALALRGRVEGPRPTALLDLAKPAMKMGIVELKVGWKAHELLVSVKADKKKYQPREKAKVAIYVKTATGAKLPRDAEVTVVAVDEALLRLKENTSWDILRAMMGQRSLAVSTSSAQNQVVGRRHFGSKAKLQGGGGGALGADTREFFEPVLCWHPRLKLNASGEAKITVPLNDSMTRFQIVAVATAGEDFFGNGKVTVESSKDLIVYSGFAPLVREGDHIQNTFTVRNTATKPMKVSLDVSATGIAELPKIPALDLNPSVAKTVSLPITIPKGLKEVSFRIKAKDELSGTEDALTAKVRIEPAVPAQVLQATLFQLDKKHQIPVKQSTEAIPGSGGLGIHVRESLISGLVGVKTYMDEYPYSCLEQRISRGIALEDKNEVKHLIESLPSYLDGHGLLKFFSASRCGSPQLTRYVLGILHENGYEIPQHTRDQMLTGLTSYIQGQYSCRPWRDDFSRNSYSNQEKILLMEVLSKYKKFTTNLLSTARITPNLWKSEAVSAWFQLLKREVSIPNQAAQLKQTENILRSRIHFQGSMMNLQGEQGEIGQWRLFTSSDQETIGVFAVALAEKSWEQDIGRMARGLIARLRRGHWDTTMANAWGITQLRRFSEKYEREQISGETKVSLGDMNESVSAKTSGDFEKILLPWPKGSEKNTISLQFSHIGSGKPWIHFETQSAIPVKKSRDMGYQISRKITPVVQNTSGVWHVGDVVNVELTILARSDQPWVVVHDPIPAGATHLGTGLDGSSQILDRAPKRSDSVTQIQDWPTEYEERSNASFIAYAAYLPRGTYRLNYRFRLNAAGEFQLPPSRVEAMYAPENFGEDPHASWKVSP